MAFKRGNSYDYKRVRRIRLLQWQALGLALGCVLVVAGLNLHEFKTETANWLIVGALGVGTVLAAVLGVAVFATQRIGLLPWMLMFVFHAAGMALSMRAFAGMGGTGGAFDFARVRDVGLLALVLFVALLVRGAALLRTAERMPGWLVVRKEGAPVRPRLWVFALFWGSPLAWCVGLLTAASYFGASRVTKSAEVWTSAVLIFCIVVAMTRAALSFVVLEKNKYAGTRRRDVLIGAFACCGVITFYGYVCMTVRVRMGAHVEAVTAYVDQYQRMLLELQPQRLEPSENAETIYKLADVSSKAVNWKWMNANWKRPESEIEIQRNLTGLSYFLQAAKIEKASSNQSYEQIHCTVFRTGDSALAALVDARQSALRGDWTTAQEDFRACTTWIRHHQADPFLMPPRMSAAQELLVLETILAACVETEDKVDDLGLIGIRNILEEHLAKRGNALLASNLADAISNFLLRNSGGIKHEEWPHLVAVREATIWNEPNDGAPETEYWVHTLSALRLSTKQNLDIDGIDQVFNPRSAEWLRRKSWNTELDNIPRLARNIDWGVVLDDLENVTLIRFAQASIGILRYKRYYGEWPAKLEDCVPRFMSGIPPDPYKHGEKIRYESSPPRVYSIGTAGAYLPEKHGSPPVGLSAAFSRNPVVSENGNVVLFLGN